MGNDKNSGSEEGADGFFDYVEDSEGINSPPVPKKRPRGILSHTDREYLWGQKEYKHPQSEANRRQEIRTRVSNAFQDFLLLWWALDSDERDQIFDEMLPDIQECLVAMIAFAYLGLNQDEERFERIVENGLYFGANYDQTARSVGEATDVDVSIDIEYNPDVDAIYERLQEGTGDQLTPGEIGVLVREGKLDASDLEALEASSAPSGIPLPTSLRGIANIKRSELPEVLGGKGPTTEENSGGPGPDSDQKE